MSFVQSSTCQHYEYLYTVLRTKYQLSFVQYCNNRMIRIDNVVTDRGTRTSQNPIRKEQRCILATNITRTLSFLMLRCRSIHRVVRSLVYLTLAKHQLNIAKNVTQAFDWCSFVIMKFCRTFTYVSQFANVRQCYLLSNIWKILLFFNRPSHFTLAKSETVIKRSGNGSQNP